MLPGKHKKLSFFIVWILKIVRHTKDKQGIFVDCSLPTKLQQCISLLAVRKTLVLGEDTHYKLKNRPQEWQTKLNTSTYHQLSIAAHQPENTNSLSMFCSEMEECLSLNKNLNGKSIIISSCHHKKTSSSQPISSSKNMMRVMQGSFMPMRSTTWSRTPMCIWGSRPKSRKHNCGVSSGSCILRKEAT